MNEYQKKCLHSAITTMRDACVEAERCVANPRDRAAEYTISAVMHSFVWGLANAYSQVESALREE